MADMKLTEQEQRDRNRHLREAADDRAFMRRQAEREPWQDWPWWKGGIEWLGICAAFGVAFMILCGLLGIPT